ncbi:MAG TPA: sulfatase-like hydrolase/transferase [Vicinamibacterales bacterium]|nr:sulfatase-like hydrolase/transferase [Vicinamibacterales bacterium]
MRKSVPAPARQAPLPSWRRRGVLAIVAVIVLVTAVAAIAALAWRLYPRAFASAEGTRLGSLPAGVARDRLNLVVVTLDTTRADHMGAYGNTAIETPTFDGLAHDGVLFEQAVSAAPLTLPVHSSIFTGKFPPEHGVRDNGGFFLGPEQVTLAEILHANGYRTGGFIAAYVLDSKWGINQGFDTYFDHFDLNETRAISLAAIQRPGNEVVDHALPWIDSVKSQRFFAWVHLYDAHSPYRPPEPFATKYKNHPYNGEIAFADSQVGRVIAELKRLGVYDRTVIMVIGDHGESLGEHGEAAHGFFVYNSTTHVPFAIRTPFSRTHHRVVGDPVRSVDVMPTALDLLGIPPPANISGVSLAPLLTGDKTELNLDAYSEAMYPLHHYGWSDLRALRSGRYKVIDAPRPELYDVDRDPGETTNLYTGRQQLADRMITHLRGMEEKFRRVQTAQPVVPMDPDTRQRLAALGYVGSIVATSADRRTGRADPKDKIAVFNELGKATELIKDVGPDGKPPFDRIFPLLTGIVREDPEVIDAWFMLGMQSMAKGDLPESVTYFKKTLDLKPDYDLAVFNLAQAYRRMGNDQAALDGLQHYLTLDPNDGYAQYEIGEIWLDRGNTARAQQMFEHALVLDPTVAAAKNALGVLALKRGDITSAERLIDEALKISPKLRLGHFNLALVAESRGDIQTAEKEYYAELQLHPDAYKAAFNMSRLYEQVGDRQGQIDALKQSIESNPKFAEGHIFLAKAYLDEGEHFDEAIELAQKGLALGPHSEMAPLAHYVLADIYNRQGRPADGAREAALGRALEARTKHTSGQQ